MAARSNLSSPMRCRPADIEATIRLKPRTYQDSCPRCGARRDPDRGIGCGHTAQTLTSRLHVAGGIIR